METMRESSRDLNIDMEQVDIEHINTEDHDI